MNQESIVAFVQKNNMCLPSNMRVRVEARIIVAKDNLDDVTIEAACFVDLLNDTGKQEDSYLVCSGKGMEELSDNFDKWFIKFNERLTFFTNENFSVLCQHRG